ncbi:MAG: hypothetical protein HY899_17220 [Deltaproteobacteria bacterium]|nr:hypothetical protein [Deltaproteobacteria bacterium]
MKGPCILTRTLSHPTVEDRVANLWQYHPRSDRHSKVSCWVVLFDLIRECPLLADQARRGKVGFGINHEMRDFTTNKKKNLDLVLCTPGTSGAVGSSGDRPPVSFRSLAAEYGMDLSPDDRQTLAGLPELYRVPVGTVHMALEAKACMTEHVKALPRLHDELNSSHLTIHGSSDHAIAAGLVVVNAAEKFLSPGKNAHENAFDEPVVTDHTQPYATERTMKKLLEIPRRTTSATNGFDAMGVVVVRMINDGSAVVVVGVPPAPQSGDIVHYDQMIRRIQSLYEAKFSSI